MEDSEYAFVVNMNIAGVIFTPLSIIDTDGGDVLHAMRSSDLGYGGFGEAYFSTIDSGAIKGWKSHQEMILNLVARIGAVRFVIFDDRVNSPTKGEFDEVILSRENYGRLTIPPLLWVGFQGVDSSSSILLNVASIEHSPEEVNRRELNEIEFDWGLKR